MGNLSKKEKERRALLAEQGLKVCCVCKAEKLFVEFSRSKQNSDGYYSKCKSCVSKYQEENKRQILLKKKEYRNKNKNKIAEYQKKYLEENKDELNRKKRQHYRKNKKEILETQRRILKKKYHTNPIFKMQAVVRSGIARAFKYNGFSKDSSTQDVLGCSYEQFVLWLGGTPKNGQHIDHVIPQSLAESEIDAYLLNHYTNFQLLSANVNISKGNRYIKKENLNRVLKNSPNPKRLQEIVECSQIEII